MIAGGAGRRLEGHVELLDGGTVSRLTEGLIVRPNIDPVGHQKDNQTTHIDDHIVARPGEKSVARPQEEVRMLVIGLLTCRNVHQAVHPHEDGAMIDQRMAEEDFAGKKKEVGMIDLTKRMNED